MNIGNLLLILRLINNLLLLISKHFRSLKTNCDASTCDRVKRFVFCATCNRLHAMSVKVNKYECIIVRTKSQLDWLNLPQLPILPPPVTAKQQVVIPGDQLEEGIDGYGLSMEGKTLRKGSFKTRVLHAIKRSASDPEYDDGEELGDDEGSN